LVVSFLLWRCGPTRAMVSSYFKCLDHPERYITVSRTPLDERSARHRELYLHDSQHFQQTDIYACSGIRTRNPSKRADTDPRSRPRGHWDRLNLLAPELFSFILAHPVYKMWIIQEPNTLELRNKLHFGKKRRVYNVFKIFSTYICWINIQNETLEVSGAVRPL